MGLVFVTWVIGFRRWLYLAQDWYGSQIDDWARESPLVLSLMRDYIKNLLFALLFIVSFFVGKITFAETTETFESLNYGDNVNTLANFNASINVFATSTAYLGTRGASISKNTDQIKISATSTRFAFWFNTGNTAAYDGINFPLKYNNTTLLDLRINFDASGGDNFAVWDTSLHLLASTTPNTWFFVDIILSSGSLKIYLDGDLEYLKITEAQYLDSLVGNPQSGDSRTTMYFDNMLYDLTDVDDFSSVGIVELPEMGEVTVQVGSEDFEFPEHLWCSFDQTDCRIRINYRFEDIGSMVLLLPEDAESVIEYVDVITELQNKDSLFDYLDPTIRSSSSTDQYRIFVSPTSGSSTLYEMVNVHWVDPSQLTENANMTQGIMGYFRNLFPLSVVLQIKSIFDNWSTASTTPIAITFNDLIPAEYSGVTNVAPILQKDLINDNLSIWQAKIYPFMETLVWIFGFIYLIFRMKSLFTSEPEGE